MTIPCQRSRLENSDVKIIVFIGQRCLNFVVQVLVNSEQLLFHCLIWAG